MSDNNSLTQPKAEQMFLGEHERGFDSKGRTTLPATFRDALGDEVAFLTRSLDPCLLLVPRDYFMAWREQLNTPDMRDAKARQERRLVFSSATEVVPDGQGRILIPDFLRDYAGINGNVIFAGIDSYIEIWDAKRWAELRNGFTEVAVDAFKSLGR